MQQLVRGKVAVVGETLCRQQDAAPRHGIPYALTRDAEGSNKRVSVALARIIYTASHAN